MDEPSREQLVQRAVEEVLLPLARLCVGHAVPFARAEELLKRAFVRAAREARRAAGERPGRDVSQVAVATGLNRREVARIGAELKPRAMLRPAPATQLLTHWLADPALQSADGRPRELPRQGPPPSFEALAATVTRHVHPRSLLDDLVRLGLVERVEDGDRVRVRIDRVVPDGDEDRLFGLLAANVGDHFEAAVANVLGRDRRHLEQAVFSSAMSTEAVQALRPQVEALWKQMLGALVPAMEKLIDEDRAAGRHAGERVRVGMYSYHEPVAEEGDETSE
jgi:hypothetical protein